MSTYRGRTVTVVETLSGNAGHQDQYSFIRQSDGSVVKVPSYLVT